MSADGRTLVVIGTPGGTWPRWAGALLHETPGLQMLSLTEPDTEQLAALSADAAAADGWVGIVDGGSRVADALAERLGDAVIVAFVERPEFGLAAALDADADAAAFDASAWLTRWHAGGRQLIRSAQRQRQRFLLVDAGEAMQQPAALLNWLREQQVPDLAADPPWPDAPTLDALALAVAQRVVAERHDVLALQQELAAGCVVLCDDSATSAELVRASSADGAALTERLLALRADRGGHAHAQAAEALAATLRQQVDALTATVARQAGQLDEARTALDSALRDAAAASQRSTELEHALQQAQSAHAVRDADATAATQQLEQSLQRSAVDRDALQAATEQLQALQATLAQREGAVAQLQTVRQNAEWLSGKVKRTQALLDQHRTDSAQAAATAKHEVMRLTAALADATAHAAAVEAAGAALQLESSLKRDERDALLAQLHDAQEALEESDLRRRKLEAGVKAAAPAVDEAAALEPGRPERALAVSSEQAIGDVRILSARREPPYLELSLSLRRVRWHKRDVPEAAVRLVEHHGHPGLAIFAGKGQRHLLRGWCETGVEDGQPFQLLVPSDAASIQVFDALNGDDWQLLLVVAARIDAEIAAAREPVRKAWAPLARRLQQQLLELPRRLRYAGLAVQAIDGAAGALAVRMHRVSWGARELRRLSAHWCPADGSVVLLVTEREPPLLSWPSVSDDDFPPAQLALPIGRTPTADAAKRWARLPQPDRDFVIAVLSVWPDVAAATPAELLQPLGMSAAALAQAAASVQRDARAALAPAGSGDGAAAFANVLRRAARRLRQRPVEAV